MFGKLGTALLVFYALFWVPSSNCHEVENTSLEEDIISAEEKENIEKNLGNVQAEDLYELDMADAVKIVEDLSLNGQKNLKWNAPEYDTHIDILIAAIDKIHKAVTYFDNVERFFQANGVIKVFSNNLSNNNVKLRAKLLVMLKDMFEVSPDTMTTLLPFNLLDRLLDIFEKDRNLEHKAHALEILNKWLPNNPNGQARVMKTKGLEPFYKQINKLNTDLTLNLMKLFNKILDEHLNIRSDRELLAKDDGEKLVVYQRIGLIERMSTPMMCKGLLNIFEMLWSNMRNESGNNVVVILDLVKKTTPFCKKIYRDSSRATELIEKILKYIKDKGNKEYFEEHGVEASDYVMILETCLADVQPETKDEL